MSTLNNTPSTEIADPYCARTAAILQGLKDVGSLGPQMTVGELRDVTSKHKTQKFVLLEAAQKLDKVLAAGLHPGGLAQFEDDLGINFIPVGANFKDTTVVGSIGLETPRDDDQEHEEHQGFLELVTFMNEVLEDPCGNLDGNPYEGINDAQLCQALGEEILQLDPRKPLSELRHVARVMAVASQCGSFQQGRGFLWLEELILSDGNPTISLNLGDGVA